MTAASDAAPDHHDEPGAEAALLVLLPGLEPVVSPHRSRLDPSSLRGVPAHITVLYPFLPVPTDAELALVAGAVASVPRFRCVLAGTRWFADEVVWVAPEPADPFNALTRAVCAAFPHLAPYGGQIAGDDLVPHATVGQRGAHASVDDLREVEPLVAEGLPIEAHVTEVTLMRGSRSPGSWHVVDGFPLG